MKIGRPTSEEIKGKKRDLPEEEFELEPTEKEKR